MGEADASGDSPASERRLPRLRTLVVAGLFVVAALWILPVIIEALDLGDGLPGVELETVSYPYLLIAGFVTFDTIIPILPSESLLTAASTIASESGALELGLIFVAGMVGAIVGDTMLYWLSRTLLRNALSTRLEQALNNPKIAAANQVLAESAPLLIIAGRFVPGMRFVVGASMGVAQYPYPKFLLWTTIGGIVWSAYTSLLSFRIAERLGDYPVLSIVTSMLLTGVIMVAMYFPLKHRFDRAEQQQDEQQQGV